jgi:hypothetical protein
LWDFGNFLAAKSKRRVRPTHIFFSVD